MFVLLTSHTKQAREWLIKPIKLFDTQRQKRRNDNLLTKTNVTGQASLLTKR